jgi:hypothetical protein
MTEPLNDRFETVARAKLAALTDVYRRLDAEPSENGDKALYQRQSASKALLTHIVLLRKLLHLDAPAAAAARDALDVDAYRAMVAALDEVGEDG